MPNATPKTRYDAVAQTLHWVIAALIVTQFALAWTFDDLPLGMHKLALVARHKSFGMTILMLAVVRLGWRLTHTPPPLPTTSTPLERFLAQLTHIGFYVLLFAMPLSGWLMSSAKSYSVSWFGVFTWPDLIGKDESSFNILRETHDVLSWALLALAILHVFAALKHHFWDKDNVLRRMLPFTNTETRP